MFRTITKRALPNGFCQMALQSRVTLSRSMSVRSLHSSSTKGRDTGAMTELQRDFLDPEMFFYALKKKNLDFFTGVPDSLLADFCAYVTDNTTPENHTIAVNEGHAVTLAAGYHLATGKIPVVYMQNSGFGNVVNPLMSLCDPKVYSIPMLLLIGWRGEPGKKDEPQHMVQGKIQTSLLASMGINFEVLPDYQEGAEQAVEFAVHQAQTRGAPYALLVKRQTFLPYTLSAENQPTYEEDLLTREEALKAVLNNCGVFDAFVTTTGFTSREVYEYRHARGETCKREFLTVGSMGYASSIAQGIAMGKPSRQVICIDGDGAALMHMGTMASIGSSGLKNYKHILINNGCHDSVGGQPTIGQQTNFCEIARASGYKHISSVTTAEEITEAVSNLSTTEGPVFLEVNVKRGTRKDLGRPKSTPAENKQEFMSFLST